MFRSIDLKTIHPEKLRLWDSTVPNVGRVFAFQSSIHLAKFVMTNGHSRGAFFAAAAEHRCSLMRWKAAEHRRTPQRRRVFQARYSRLRLGVRRSSAAFRESPRRHFGK